MAPQLIANQVMKIFKLSVIFLFIPAQLSARLTCQLWNKHILISRFSVIILSEVLIMSVLSQFKYYWKSFLVLTWFYNRGWSLCSNIQSLCQSLNILVFIRPYSSLFKFMSPSSQGIFDVSPDRLITGHKYGDVRSSQASSSLRSFQEFLAKIKICLKGLIASLSTLANKYSELAQFTYERKPLAFLWCQ